MPERRTAGWVCCFCSATIPDLGEDSDEPLVLEARGARDHSAQAFFAHLACLRQAIHPRIPIELPRRLEEEEFGIEVEADE